MIDVAGNPSGPISTPAPATPSPGPPPSESAAAPVRDRERVATPWWRRPGVLLAAVALVHAALPLALLGRHWFIGIDESVYLSQLNAHVPPGGFSAPRARGSTLLAAPVTLLTASIPAMRVWTSLLSGVGLYLAFRPWLRLREGYVVPLAAALFASIWSVTYYGFQVMPNEWVGFAVVGACGSLLRYLLDGRWTSLAGAALAMVAAALLRPSDAAFAVLALGAVCLLARVPWRRRLTGVVVLGAGTALGVAEWVIEAYTSYGGLHARLHAAEVEQGGSGLYFSLGAQSRVLAGPLLCRTGCHASAAIAYRLWWVAAALLVVMALATLRRRRPILDLAPIALGVVTAAQYVFTVGYAAPRFLIPSYAALALPVATGMAALVRSVRRVRSPVGPARWPGGRSRRACRAAAARHHGPRRTQRASRRGGELRERRRAAARRCGRAMPRDRGGRLQRSARVRVAVQQPAPRPGRPARRPARVDTGGLATEHAPVAPVGGDVAPGPPALAVPDQRLRQSHASRRVTAQDVMSFVVMRDHARLRNTAA